MPLALINQHGDTPLRRIRGWAVILMMAVALVGGSRTATRATEETSAEETSEVLEFVHRLTDGCQRSLRGGSASRPELTLNEPRAGDASIARHGTRDLPGAVPFSGHQLSNGLCAPQRC